MNVISVKICSESDLDLLAQMNSQLIKDEGHDNKMNIHQLRERMDTFVHSGYNVYFFKNDGNVIGYALVDMTKQPLYLRQFFISEDFRRAGFGTDAFNKLLETLNTDTLDIEILYWNKRGRRFWSSLGFKERSVYMRYGEF